MVCVASLHARTGRTRQYTRKACGRLHSPPVPACRSITEDAPAAAEPPAANHGPPLLLVLALALALGLLLVLVLVVLLSFRSAACSRHDGRSTRPPKPVAAAAAAAVPAPLLREDSQDDAVATAAGAGAEGRRKAVQRGRPATAAVAMVATARVPATRSVAAVACLVHHRGFELKWVRNMAICACRHACAGGTA